MLHAIGTTLLVVPFIGLAWLGTKVMGVWPTVGAFVITAGIFAVIVTGVILLNV